MAARSAWQQPRHANTSDCTNPYPHLLGNDVDNWVGPPRHTHGHQYVATCRWPRPTLCSHPWPTHPADSRRALALRSLPRTALRGRQQQGQQRSWCERMARSCCRGFGELPTGLGNKAAFPPSRKNWCPARARVTTLASATLGEVEKTAGSLRSHAIQRRRKPDAYALRLALTKCVPTCAKRNGNAP